MTDFLLIVGSTAFGAFLGGTISQTYYKCRYTRLSGALTMGVCMLGGAVFGGQLYMAAGAIAFPEGKFGAAAVLLLAGPLSLPIAIEFALWVKSMAQSVNRWLETTSGFISSKLLLLAKLVSPRVTSGTPESDSQ